MYSHAANMHSDESFKISSTHKISNISYEADLKHTLRYTRYLLGVLGVWSMVSQKSSKTERNFSKFLILVCLLSPGIIIIPVIRYIITSEQSMIAQLVFVPPLGFFISNFVKYVFIVFRCRMFKFCIEHMRTDWMRIESKSERSTMKRNIKVGHDLTIICSVFMYSCSLFYYTIMPLWSGKTVNQFNETVRPLVYPGYDAFLDTQSSPAYEIIFFTISVSAFIGITMSIACYTCAAVFVTHACGQVQILISRIGSLVEDIDDCENNDCISDRISVVIRCHVRALRLASNIEVILSEISFIEVFASTLIICVVEYCFMMEWKNSGFVGIITYLLVFMAQSSSLYVYFHIGELLNEQYHKIGVAAYMVQWYRLPGKMGTNLIMIIIMANCTRKMKACNMIELTIRNFSNIMRMSITYFNMLRNLAD